RVPRRDRRPPLHRSLLAARPRGAGAARGRGEPLRRLLPRSRRAAGLLAQRQPRGVPRGDRCGQPRVRGRGAGAVRAGRRAAAPMTAADAAVTVVGGGVVGAAVTHALAARGEHVLLLEAEPGLALGASGTNSGILHT